MATPVGKVRSQDALRQIAESQVAGDIQGQVSPYEAEIGSAKRREQWALGDVSKMFSTLQPYVSQAANKVGESWQQATAGQSQIFDSAQQRLAALKQGRAAEAQAIAQEIGGPVGMTEFMKATAGAEEALPMVTGNSLLHGLGMAEAGTQEAQAFAGKVFPALRVETQAKARNFYEDQIKTAEQQIASIKSGAKGKQNERYNELLTAERTYAQGQATLGLQKTQAAHDWVATKAGIAQENKRIQMAQDQFKQTQDLAKTTEAHRHGETVKAETAQEKQFQKTYGLNVRQQRAAEKQAATAKVAASRQTATELIDWMVTGHSTDVKRSTDIPVAAPPRGKIPKGYYHYSVPDPKHPKGPKIQQWFYRSETTTTQQDRAPVKDPYQVVDFLIAEKIPRAMAVTLVRTKFGLGPKWTGQRPKKPPVNKKYGPAENPKSNRPG